METDWEQRYRSGDTAWDRGAPAPALLRFLEEQPLTGRVLVPGCGFGHDAAAIGAAGARQVVGLDLAPSAVAGARARHSLPILTFENGDFLDGTGDWMAPLDGPFDSLFEHTLFCAINPARRLEYARSAAASVRPGGLFLAIFYMTPDPTRGDGPPFGTQGPELDALFSSFFKRVEETVPDAAYPGREGRELLVLFRRNSEAPDARGSGNSAS